jgi:hypothetical protein
VDTRVQDNDIEAAIQFDAAVESAIRTENAGAGWEYKKMQGRKESRMKVLPGVKQDVAVVPANRWMRCVH